MRPITAPPYVAASVATADQARFLVSALGAVAEDGRPYLLIATHPGVSDAEIREATDALTAGSALAELVEVVGNVAAEPRAELFERAVAVLVAGTEKADGDALVLAASLGAPLVGPASTSAGWPIIESVTGIPLEEPDAAEWAAVIDTLVRTPDLGDFLGAGAGRWAAENGGTSDRPDSLPFDTMS